MMKYKLSRTQTAWIRWLSLWLLGFLAVVLLVPWLLVSSPTGESEQGKKIGAAESGAHPSNEAVMVQVHLSGSQATEAIELESYVLGVVAAEMPIEFEPEALKAQALAARTYIVRRLLNGETANMAGTAAVVTDTTQHQAYLTDEELKRRWGPEKYESNRSKLRQAVEATRGVVITYGGQPIEASYFSTSNGYTENSEDYWNMKLPYLRSVPSPWDERLSPKYKDSVTITAKELQQKLGLPSAVPAATGGKSGLSVLERSEGQRIKRLTAGGRTFTGREFREKLGLASSQFQWSYQSGKWTFTTTGYGHGVGMSQWGANGMAKEGRTAKEIIQYYYTGVQLEQAANLWKGKSF
ncbi:stage II sporulation protein D [Paenibacillus sp. UNCCL117]|uniref:stage II sporulation protein D n=1 Tax=unclassified Paenibacillus TaxID=185978 RepID=UPI000890747B|nr:MULTISPECIES: stage II sporulation protein D [unclassified Paenibacillus]SDE34418.1 stage II sporulation protein D [Paenibacillus sp. cl123]SFW64272.1 stage II sporulation protein D [Paenibacillus sp. UNCCL117]